jgi:hypothetical protein
MRQIIYTLLFSCLTILSSCSSKMEEQNNIAISIIKQSTANGEISTWEQFLTNAAGIEGNIKWRAFDSEEKSPNIKVVEVTVIKKHKTDQDILMIQWKVNIESKYCKIAYIAVNEKPQSLLLGLMTIEGWTLDN